MDQFNSRNDDDEHFRAVAHDLHDLHAQTNPQILAEKLHKFFVKHSGLHPDQARNVVEGMFQKAGRATHFADGGPVDKALNVVGQQQADPVAVAKQVASMPPVRQLSPMGLYSHGAEAAAALPQAKGSPQQMKAMLKGVKQEELAGYDDAFAGKKSVTKDEIAQHFRDQMPVVEETVLGRDQLSLKERHRYYDLDDAVAKDGVNALSPEQQQEYYALQNKWNQEKPTKFGQYSLPGGENYREVLLKMPEGYGAPKQALDDLAAARQRFKDLDKRHTDELHAGLTGDMNMSYEDFDKLTRDRDIAESRVKNFEKLANQPAFQSGHWQDPNVLAHLRMADRTGPNGEKILHVEEIQSDWGQKGKKEGFKVPLTPELESSANAIIESKLQPGAEFMNPSWRTKEGKVDPRAVTPSYVEFLEKNGTISPDEAQTLKVWNKARGFDASGVPTAPYVTNTQAWTDLALKRALREAAEGGYDKLVWTPGAEQAKRYNLSQQVSKLQYFPKRERLQAFDHEGRSVIDKEGIPRDKLPEFVGKDVANKLLSDEHAIHNQFIDGILLHEMRGQDLSIGGEGMKGYYDKIVPKRLQELIKKHDPSAKVGYTDVMLPPKAGVGHNNPPFEAPGITITPKMRESILKGQPAFKRGGAIPLHPALNIPGVHIRTAEAGEPIFHGDK